MTETEPASEPAPKPTDEHERVEERFSEYFERSLPQAESDEIKAHLESCDRCRDAYKQFQHAVTALPNLHKMPAPPSFEDEVEDAIRRRSAGRFFGRKAFGDRVPFELLAVLALILGLVVFGLIYYSQTGSLRYESDPGKPEIAPNADRVIPKPTELGQ